MARFDNSAMTKRPQLAETHSVKSEDYIGYVMPTWQSASLNTSTQINKAIPILVEMRNDIKDMKRDLVSVKENTNAIPKVHEEIKALREDVQSGFAMQFRQVQSDVRSIKERLGMP